MIPTFMSLLATILTYPMVCLTFHTSYALNSTLPFLHTPVPLYLPTSISGATVHSVVQVRNLRVHLDFLLRETNPPQQVFLVPAPKPLSNPIICHLLPNPSLHLFHPQTSARAFQCLLRPVVQGINPLCLLRSHLFILCSVLSKMLSAPSISRYFC